MYLIDELDIPPHALLVVLVVKLHTRWRRSALFARGLMRLFPAISARKGADERKVGFFFKTSKRRRSTCGTFGNCPFPYRLPTAIPAYLFQQAEVFEPADSASPLDSAAAIRAEPQFQEHRRTRTVAEFPRLPPPQSV